MAFERIFEIPYHQSENHPQKDTVASKVDGKWKAYSTQEFLDIIQNVSRGLLALGVEKGENVGMISFNRPEWNFIDLGMQQIGAINVPLYPNISKKEYKYILNDAGIKQLFVEDQELYDMIADIKDEVDSLEHIYTFEKLEKADHWKKVLENASDEYDDQIEEIKSQINKDDLATIVYTSGTTGDPKGVMLSHNNIVSNIKACLPLLPVGSESKALSFLPLNHIFERMLNYLYIAAGVSVYYAEDIDSIGDNLKEVKPEIFTTVPRLMEKIYEKIVSKGKEQPLLKRAIFFGALNLANDYELEGKSWWYKQLLSLSDSLVFSKWRDAVGGNVKVIVSGGAAMNPKLIKIFTAAGLPILEGYGLTETSPVISVNRWEKEGRKFGTVGKPIEKVEVKIADDGEVLCKGPNVMMGYYNMEEKTNEVIEDGWFHTDDVGSIDEKGFLSIKDRKDSVFKTSGGKKVAPQPIENTLKESFLIDQVIILGEGRKMVTALISPDFDNLKGWCEDNDIDFESKEKVIENEDVIQRYEEIVEEKNEEFSHTEQIKKFRLVPDNWTVDSGELTPTQKVKREVVKDKYEDLIDKMYKEAK